MLPTPVSAINSAKPLATAAGPTLSRFASPAGGASAAPTMPTDLASATLPAEARAIAARVRKIGAMVGWGVTIGHFFSLVFSEILKVVAC